MTYRVALISTGCFGDCINSTLCFEPIKKHYGNCTIDVYTSTKYHTAFINNPHINKLHQVQADTKHDALHLNEIIKPRDYDLVIKGHPLFNRVWDSTQHPQLGENLILAWVSALEANNIPVELPLTTSLHLTDEELDWCNNFINRFAKNQKIALMECEGESGQSPWREDWTPSAIRTLIAKGYIVLASCVAQKTIIQNMQIQHKNKVIWVGGASIRTVSGMFDHCDLFISVSSGLSNACNVAQRRPINKWIEVVNDLTCSSNVVGCNDKVFWHRNNKDDFCDYLRDTL